MTNCNHLARDARGRFVRRHPTEELVACMRCGYQVATDA